jgi:uncharacterized protein (TIGR02147 family)
MENKHINIYIYLEYRKYLKEYYAFQKKRSKSFTYRHFSQSAGFSTPNFLQLLIQGKRNLKKSSIAKVSHALHHSIEEAAYFELLVNFDQAKTVAEKTHYFMALSEARKPYQISPIHELQFEHLRTWYHKAIRELLGFYAFNEKEQYAYRKLAALLSPPITEREARNSVKLLLKLGLLKRSEDGSIIQAERFISTGDEVRNLSVRTFHQAMIQRAGEAVDRINPEHRDISSLTVTVSDNGFAMLKKELQLFRKRLLEVVKSDSDPKNVYQVNFQLFPLTNTKKADSVHRVEDEKK